MKTACVINLENKTIKIDYAPDAKRLILDFMLEGTKNKKYNFRNVRFGYQLQVRDGDIIEKTWPIEGISFTRATPGIITSEDIKLTIDTDYKLLVWYEREGYRATDVAIFNSGKPYKEYDSMIWNEETEEWDYAKPYPEDAFYPHVWDEESLEWVEAE